MTLQGILKKIANDEALTDEEKDFAGKYDEQVVINNASKSARIKAESARDAAIAERDALKKQIEDGAGESQAQKSDYETRVKALEKSLNDIKGKNEAAEKRAAALERSALIRDLAQKHGVKLAAGTIAEKAFTLLVEEHVGDTKLDDDDAVKAVFDAFAKDNPGIIAVESGGGANIKGAPTQTTRSGENPWNPQKINYTRQGEIMDKDRHLAEKLAAEHGQTLPPVMPAM